MKYLILNFFIYLNVQGVLAQSISVIYIDGNVKTSGINKDYIKISQLVFGPVLDEQLIILPKNARVKLIKSDNLYCELSTPGSYMIKDLKFNNTENTSTLDNFLQYFKSFFAAHPNSESKENYYNSISAMSRGEESAPILEFPFNGSLPLLKKGITFNWGSICDSCTFILKIQDFDTKAEQYQYELKGKKHTITAPHKLFQVNKKYMWSVSIKYTDIVSEFRTFSTTDYASYKNTISTLDKSFKKSHHKYSPEIKMLSIFHVLEIENKINYMILFGQEQVTKDPSNKILQDYYNRIYYDQL